MKWVTGGRSTAAPSIGSRNEREREREREREKRKKKETPNPLPFLRLNELDPIACIIREEGGDAEDRNASGLWIWRQDQEQLTEKQKTIGNKKNNEERQLVNESTSHFRRPLNGRFRPVVGRKFLLRLRRPPANFGEPRDTRPPPPTLVKTQ